jgi:hypothetical protein
MPMHISTCSARAVPTLLGLAFATSLGATPAPSYIFGDGFEPGPLLWYRFEGDATNTGSLSGYTLTLSNATYDAGEFGQAISFGTNGYAYVAGMQNALGVLPQVTVGFWIYESAVASRDYWDVGNRSTPPYGGVSFYENMISTTAVCVSNTTDPLVTGSCPFFASPTTGAWHHWIISYAGTGTGSGQGGPVNIYLDDVLQQTVSNDASNNPVFNSGISDTLYIGGNGALMDDLRIYDRIFTPAEQCARIIDGVWTGSSCILP